MQTVEISLTRGKVAVVDAADAPLVSRYSWYALHVEGLWYAQAKIEGGRRVLMHRMILGLDGPMTDHRDGDGLNNRRSNLRPCTRSQNMANKKKHRNSTNPYKGIDKYGHKWRARIRVNTQRLSLGIFLSAEDAARAYDDAARLHFGEFALTNFPP